MGQPASDRAAHPRYPRVFSPIRIGPVEVANRFYLSPHAVPHTTPGGGPSEDFVRYYESRMKDGGCGLAILSLIIPERTKGVQPRPHDPANVPDFRRFAEAVHAAGGKTFGELWYWWGRPGGWARWSPPAPSFNASNVQYINFEKGFATREMTKGDLARMRQAYRQSAENLRDAGFDGIMIHASHGALMEQFNSPYFNRRTDEYGGGLENRLRFLKQVLGDAREVAAGRMAVGVRLNCDELLTGGYHTEGARELVASLAGSGLVDFFDLDVAIEPNQFHLGMPSVFVEPHAYRPYVEAVRGAAGDIPVLSVLSRLTSVEQAEAAIAAGVCDMAGAARALIAEPKLARYAREGREADGRTCIACNWCMAALPEGAQTCAINPESWREVEWGDDSWAPAPKASKVIVVGAGPGGLEAARVAALRGHEVTLVEAREQVGGALALWSRLPRREVYMKSVEWWSQELARLGVKIRLGAIATPATLLAEAPDAVILATGARYDPDGRSFHRDFAIPGCDRDFVHLPEAVLEGVLWPSGRVVIADGEGMHTGVGLAEALALAGAEVELLTPAFSPVSLRIAAQLELIPLMKRLRAAGVKVTPTTWIKEIGERRLTVYDVYDEARERVIEEVDAVILAGGRVAVNALEHELEGKVAQVFSIGDAAAARMWGAAAYEGQKFARLIGEPGAPASIGELYFTLE
jgi:2,4-dienoyl-CoA reductase-like NADH-dependent reductase (Old Yellow Enzyme family)